MRPEERDDRGAPKAYGLQPKLASECIGTLMLVLTAGLNVLAMSLVHVNPAVTDALWQPPVVHLLLN